MKKFKYPLAIEGTPEQIRNIREELLKLGYEDHYIANEITQKTRFMLTQFKAGFSCGMDFFFSIGCRQGEVISADDLDLILALAAAVDDNYNFYEGEVVVATRTSGEEECEYKEGDLYVILSVEERFIRTTSLRTGHTNGWHDSNFRKATKEEIINQFSDMKENDLVVDPGSERVFAISESFIKEAHAAACRDCKSKIEAKFPEVFGGYGIGQRFRYHGAEWILAQVAPSQVALISLEDGNRFREGFEVAHIFNITSEEFSRISNGEFTFISDGKKKEGYTPSGCTVTAG